MPFATVLRFWLWLGCISFGGPAGQIAVMHAELVERRRWLSERRFLHALNYCMVLPGPEAQQLATYTGWLLHGTRGGLAAGSLFALPSLLLLCGLSWAYLVWGETALLAGLLYGINPAVTAIVLHAGWRLGHRVLRDALRITIAALAFLALTVLSLPFPLLIGLAAGAGLLGRRFAPQRFTTEAPPPEAAAATDAADPCVIDDDTMPAHLQAGWGASLRVLAVGLLLWLAGISALLALLGPDNPINRMALFFSGAALVTFGGAYAVLPHVQAMAVERAHWLTPSQMLDGLALGETTPGPLIIVVAFVSLVGGWQAEPLAEALGPGHRLAAAALAATVATAFTFLPSFVFILAGAPWVERRRDDLRFDAPLAGITAAVVGVIGALALFFATQTLWRAGIDGRFEWPALAIGSGALWALWALSARGASTPRVIAGCAAAGLALRALP